MLDKITPVILTFNEQANIVRTLSALEWANQIVVVDSFSSDTTESLCKQFSNVRFVQRTFDQHAKQWNFALECATESEWILALDADHVLTKELVRELELLKPKRNLNGYWVTFNYKISGKILGHSLYPPLVSLFRRESAHYIQDGHTQRVQIQGCLSHLHSKIIHDDRKSARRWMHSQWNYARQEAEKLSQQSWSDLTMPDKLRKSGVAPVLILPYALIAKGLIFSGWAGLVYSSQRLVAEFALQLARLNKLFTAI